MASPPSVFTQSDRQRPKLSLREGDDERFPVAGEVVQHDEGVDGASQYTAACGLMSFPRLHFLLPFNMLTGTKFHCI